MTSEMIMCESRETGDPVMSASRSLSPITTTSVTVVDSAVVEYKVGNKRPPLRTIDKRIQAVYHRVDKCQHEGCFKKPYYVELVEHPQQQGVFVRSTIFPVWCPDHKPSLACLATSRPCNVDGCTLYGQFYNPRIDRQKRTYSCPYHRSDDQTAGCARFCIVKDCGKWASYNEKGKRMPIFCKAHKSDHHVIANKPVCQVADCLKAAMYGSIESREKIFCRAHARPTDVCLLKGYLCTMPGCSSLAIWGEIDGRRHLTCTKHKKPHFVNCHIGRKRYFEQLRKEQEFAEKHSNTVVLTVEDNSDNSDSENHSDSDMSCIEFHGSKRSRSSSKSGDVSANSMALPSPPPRIDVDAAMRFLEQNQTISTLPVSSSTTERQDSHETRRTISPPIVISERSPLFDFFVNETAALYRDGNIIIHDEQ